MMSKITISLPEEMLEDIDKIIIEDRFENVPEFLRHCVRRYFFERVNNDEGSLLNDIEHWKNVQLKINKLTDEELMGMMTCSVLVERMERIAMSEIIKRLYLKTLKNDK